MTAPPLIEQELLPCPFCGGATYRHETDEEIIGAVAMGCADCGALGPFKDVDDYDNRDDAFAAAETAWNTRTLQASAVPSADEVGQLIEDVLFPLFGAGPYEALA